MSKKLLNSLILVSSFALYYIFINPLYSGVGPVWQPEKGVADLRDISVQYDAALSQVKSISEQSNLLRSQYENVSSSTIQKMEIMEPDKVDPIRLISEVNNIAYQSGVVVRDLVYSENLSTVSEGSYLVSFSVNTSYTKFKELMRNYETSLRLFKIKNITFSSPLKEGDYPTFQVKLETFYMK